jgi:hypothetical protein
MSTIIECEISLGELIDKISILKIKLKNIQDPAKLNHVRKEETTLLNKLNSLGLKELDFHLDQMIEVNSKLWKIEDDIRELERQKRFDDEFIQLARAVYITNDERFRRKNTINNYYNSSLVEVKSYKEY